MLCNCGREWEHFQVLPLLLFLKTWLFSLAFSPLFSRALLVTLPLSLSLWSTSPQEVLGLQGKKGRHFTVKTKKKESPKGRITVIPPRLFWGRAKPIACFSKIEHQVEDTPTKIIFLLQLKKTTTKTFWFPEINLWE